MSTTNDQVSDIHATTHNTRANPSTVEPRNVNLHRHAHIHTHTQCHTHTYTHASLHICACRYGARKTVKRRHATKRRPYMSHTAVDMGSAFQYALITNNMAFAAKKFNITYTTFARHYHKWKTLDEPFNYVTEETRGRPSLLDAHQQGEAHTHILTLLTKYSYMCAYGMICRQTTPRSF